MNARTATTARIAALALGLLSLTAATANATQDAGPMIRVAEASTSCPITQVGTEYVRCDDLTGNGVAAPGWLSTSTSATGGLGAAALAGETTAPATATSASTDKGSLAWRRHGI